MLHLATITVPQFPDPKCGQEKFASLLQGGRPHELRDLSSLTTRFFAAFPRFLLSDGVHGISLVTEEKDEALRMKQRLAGPYPSNLHVELRGMSGGVARNLNYLAALGTR